MKNHVIVIRELLAKNIGTLKSGFLNKILFSLDFFHLEGLRYQIWGCEQVSVPTLFPNWKKLQFSTAITLIVAAAVIKF